MQRNLDQALLDLRASESLAKKPMLTYLHELHVGMLLGDTEMNRATLAKAIAIDPKDFVIRRKYMYTITPRWGGSFEEMENFVKTSRKQGVSDLDQRTLKAMIEVERAHVSEDEKQPEEAVKHYTKAIDLDPERDQVTEALGHKLRLMQTLHPESDDVLDADRLLKLAPNHAFALAIHGHARYVAKDYSGAIVSFRLAAGLGDAYGQVMLGRMYWFGQGVSQDRGEAEDWFRRAAANGNEDARKYLKEIAADGNRSRP
jgi:tetratricopeptide (TPR) repeat protein